MNMKQWAKVIQDYWIIPKPHRKPDVWKQGGWSLFLILYIFHYCGVLYFIHSLGQPVQRQVLKLSDNSLLCLLFSASLYNSQ